MAPRYRRRVTVDRRLSAADRPGVVVGGGRSASPSWSAAPSSWWSAAPSWWSSASRSWWSTWWSTWVVLDDVVVDDDVVAVLRSPPLRASTAITAMSTTARATRPPMSQRMPVDMPPSSAGGGPAGPPGPAGAPGPPAPPAAAPAAAPPAAAAAGIAIVESGAGAGTGGGTRRGRYCARCAGRARARPRRRPRPARRSCRRGGSGGERVATHPAVAVRRRVHQAPSVMRAATAWSCTRPASSCAMPSTRSACEAP